MSVFRDDLIFQGRRISSLMNGHAIENGSVNGRSGSGTERSEESRSPQVKFSDSMSRYAFFLLETLLTGCREVRNTYKIIV